MLKKRDVAMHLLFFISEGKMTFLSARKLSLTRSDSYSCMRRICSSGRFVLRGSPTCPYLIERQSIMSIEMDYSRKLTRIALSIVLKHIPCNVACDVESTMGGLSTSVLKSGKNTYFIGSIRYYQTTMYQLRVMFVKRG